MESNIPTSPSVLTTVVGSYPVPPWLAVMPSVPNLRDAIMVVLKTQELAGIDVVADGELSRFDPNHPETNGMIEYFVHRLDGVRSVLSHAEREAFRLRQGMGFRTQPAGVVCGSLGEGTLDLSRDFERVRGLTSKPVKFTATSPYMLAKTLLDVGHNDTPALTMALAEVLRKQLSPIEAAVVQIDEANLPGSPADGSWAAEPLNHVFRGISGEKALHLCFGNYGGQTIQEGLYRDLLPFLNQLTCDHLVLEFARRGYDELQVLCDLKAEIALGIGVIDIKDNEVETPEEIARRIEGAVSVLGAERVRWVHPDCGFWMLHRTIADRKMTALVKGRDLFLGVDD